MTFGEQLEKLRSQAGLSQAELARRVGISPQLLSAYVHDKVQSPRYETAKRLAAELGCDVDTILGGDEHAPKVVLTPELTVVDELSATARGTGGFGSTGR